MTHLEIIHYITGTEEYKRLDQASKQQVLDSVQAMRSLLEVREHNLRQQQDHAKAEVVLAMIAGLGQIAKN